MRVAVAMSGGVDSLRTAALLKEQGHGVFAVHMRFLPESRQGLWCAKTLIESREAALSALCNTFGLPLHIVDLRDAFEKAVIEPFVNAYRQGLTPNPCVICNPAVKFGLLLQRALALGAERIATGHYARVLPPGPGSLRFQLCRARDLTKDQSYFLVGLQQDQLARSLFPLGDTTKQEVLQWAGRQGLPSSMAQESQEICFVPSGSYVELLKERLPEASFSKGLIVDEKGQRLGEHRGLFHYTIGQRRGLGIASTAPYYVQELNPTTHVVRVGRREELYRSELTVGAMNWISADPPEAPFRCRVRIRYRHRAATAWVTPLPDDRALVRFEEAQRAITPGQAAVFYQDDLLLGGGLIEAGFQRGTSHD